jgi:hypothetical protein
MRRALFVSMVMLMIFAGSVFAQGYLGAKTGLMMLDAVGVDDIIPIGVMGGFEFMPKMSIEGEFNYKISGGDWDYGRFGKFDWDLWVLSVYYVYRHPLNETFYIKGKAGLQYAHSGSEITYTTYELVGLDLVEVEVTEDYSGSDTDLTVGGGMGMSLNEQFGGEVEFTLMGGDFNYLSVGLRINM